MRARPLRAAVATALALAACSPAALGGGLPAGPVTIGLVTSLTGIDLPLGADVRLGAQQAVDEANAAGGAAGHPVRLAVEDDASTAGGARAAYGDLVRGGVAGVIGPLDAGSAAAVASAAASRRTPLLMTSGDDGLAGSGGRVAPNVFLAAPPASRCAARMLAYAKASSLTSVAIAHPAGDPFAESGVAALKRDAAGSGVKIAADLPFDPGAVDFKPVIDGVRSSGARLLLVWGGGAGPPQLERAWKDSGLEAPILLSPASATTAFSRAVSDSGEGALIVTTQSVLAPALPAASPVHAQVGAMASSFQRRNGYLPTQAAFDGYAAARLLIAAVAAAGSTSPARVDSELAGMNLATASGTFRYSSSDHLGLGAGWLVVAELKDGKLAPAA